MKSREEWYSITVRQLASYGGLTVVKAYYAGSIPIAMKEIYPDHDWCEWLFVRPPAGIWDNSATVRRYFEWLRLKLKLEEMQDWYGVDRNAVFENRGMGLLAKFDSSFPKAIMSAYPEHKWLPWKFTSVPQGWWSQAANQKLFLDYVAVQENFQGPTPWYSVTDNVLKRHGGHRFLALYACSPFPFRFFFLTTVCSTSIRKRGIISLVMSLYPSYDWEPWQFARGTAMTADQLRSNRKIFFDSAAKKLNLTNLSGWYNVQQEHLDKLSDASFLRRLYRGPLAKILMETYPQHLWLEWKFATVPKSFWTKLGNQQKFLEWLKEHLNINSMEDWYNVSYNEIADLGGIRLLQVRSFSLYEALRAGYPHHHWEEFKFKRWQNQGAALSES